MTDQEEAKIILEALDRRINVNWVLEKCYIESIVEGLREIRKMKQEGKSDETEF